MKVYEAKVFVDQNYILGEGPVWDEDTQTLMWTDIQDHKVFRANLNGEVTETIEFDTPVGFFALCEDGGMVLGTATGIAKRDKDGNMVEYAEPKVATGGKFPGRYNDGKCDDKGRIWAGTLGFGGYFGLTDVDGSYKQLLDEVKCSNGIAFSKDRKTLYYNDTATMKTDAFDLDYETGTISNRRTVFAYNPKEGGPDGMTIDDEDNLWVARWGGNKISCIDPRKGEEIAIVKTGALQTSSCCFGGPDMKTLFITSSGEGCEKTGSKEEGRVFCVELPVSGAKSYKFKG